MNRLLTAALDYADKGFLVVPIERYGKHMIKEEFFHKASRDSEVIKKWWELIPDANIGLPTSFRRNRLIVIDVDVNNYVDGRRSLEKLKNETGIILPKTSIVQTGSGGYHYYYKNDTGTAFWGAKNVLPGIDIRSENAHVVAPPSIHANFSKYVWIEGDVEHIAPADDNVLKLLLRIPRNRP